MTITIPPEAVEAHAKIIYEHDVETWLIEQPQTNADDYDAWEKKRETSKEAYRKLSRAACLAMLREWPGMFIPTRGNASTNPEAYGANIILPLTEPRDDKT